jgi:hypothetical protein
VGERGFALVLAILSLMLLTFLGLTLAATTSTELQIATNYRWSQQALYNAEAGLEAARVILSTVADESAYWTDQLPAVRPGPWAAGSAPAHEAGVASRDFYKDDCDTRGGIGYGRVLADGATNYENIDTFAGRSLNGAFTIWVRRALEVDNSGQYSDDADNDVLVIVSEGVAPYTGAGDAFTRSRQAVRVLETRLNLSLSSTTGPVCGPGMMQGQEGGSPMGENYNPCARINAGSGGSLEGVFGGATGTGTLDAFQDVR